MMAIPFNLSLSSSSSWDSDLELVVLSGEEGEPERGNLTDADIYYAAYEPMEGVRTALTLAGLITLFALFLVYKSYCNARRARRCLRRGTTKRGGQRSIRSRTFSIPQEEDQS